MRSLIPILAFLLAASNAMTQTREPIRYTLRFPAAASNYVEVEARVPAEGKPQVELFMAVWSPGSYLLREYSRNVEDVIAKDEAGRVRAVQKTRKNRWSIESAGAKSLSVSYRVYGREMGVRSNYVERDYAFLNGAPTFLSLPGDGSRPHEVRIERPPSWPLVSTALETVAADTWRAPDYDTLVDSPIGLGRPEVYRFTVDGVPHQLVNEGEGGVWDGPRSAADTEKIVSAARALWGFFPYPRYAFLNYITEAGGGLEHKASTLLLTSRYKTRTRRGYLGWLSLVAHEHFHAWNVKRLRPQALGPFDYEAENYTKDLWLSEGVTDYYAKGAVVGFLLDAMIRERTAGAKSLDDVMRLAYRRFAGPRGFTSSEFRSVAREAAGVDLGAFFAATLEETADLDYAPALEYFGLRFKPEKAKDEDDDKEDKGWLGLVVKTDGGRITVAQVPRDAPGHAAGFNAEDEILAVGGFRVRPDQWDSRLEAYKEGEAAEVLVARRDRLVTLRPTFAKEPKPRRLQVHPEATEEQKARLAAWLGGKSGP